MAGTSQLVSVKQGYTRCSTTAARITSRNRNTRYNRGFSAIGIFYGKRENMSHYIQRVCFNFGANPAVYRGIHAAGCRDYIH